MKKIVWGLGILVCLISGCLKSNDNNNNAVCGYNDSQVVAPATEIDSIQNYLTKNAINATKDPSGFFYTINSQGNGQPIVNLCSNITVKYYGKLVNGSGFDSTGTGTATFQLGQVITGWQKGLPLISKGGKITLYIPPTLGYGSSARTNSAGQIAIPANSILIFDIELIDIN